MNTTNNTKTNLVLDLTIFSAFLVISNPRFTGNTVHEWLGISFAAAIVTHLLLHWQWIVRIGTEFFKKLLHSSRLNFVIDILFFISMTGVMLSGILISRDLLKTLGINFNAGQNWRMIHSLTANLSLITLAVHIALHWKWITTNFDRYISSPVRSIFNNTKPVSEPAGKTLIMQPVQTNQHK